MLTHARTLLLLSSIAACSPSAQTEGAAASDAAEVNGIKSLRASTRPELELLGDLWAVRSIDNDDGVVLRLYETFPGDPAVNGNVLWLAAYDDYGDGAMFDLGLDVAKVTSAVKIDFTSIEIVGARTTVDENGATTERPFIAYVHLNRSAGNIAQSIHVEERAESRLVPASHEPAAPFTSSVHSVRKIEGNDGRDVVRVFEQTFVGGDPAMNGVSVFVEIGSGPTGHAFDLGLDVARITNVKRTGPAEVRIDASEDKMDADGNIQQTSVAYALRFEMDASGNATDTAKLTKLP